MQLGSVGVVKRHLPTIKITILKGGHPEKTAMMGNHLKASNHQEPNSMPPFAFEFIENVTSLFPLRTGKRKLIEPLTFSKTSKQPFPGILWREKNYAPFSLENRAKYTLTLINFYLLL